MPRVREIGERLKKKEGILKKLDREAVEKRSFKLAKQSTIYRFKLTLKYWRLAMSCATDETMMKYVYRAKRVGRYEGNSFAFCKWCRCYKEPKSIEDPLCPLWDRTHCSVCGTNGSPIMLLSDYFDRGTSQEIEGWLRTIIRRLKRSRVKKTPRRR